MKTTVRIFALTVALTGLISSTFTSKSDMPIAGPLTAVSSDPGPLSLPIPTCGPGVPWCGGGVVASPKF